MSMSFLTKLLLVAFLLVSCSENEAPKRLKMTINDDVYSVLQNKLDITKSKVEVLSYREETERIDFKEWFLKVNAQLVPPSKVLRFEGIINTFRKGIEDKVDFSEITDSWSLPQSTLNNKAYNLEVITGKNGSFLCIQELDGI